MRMDARYVRTPTDRATGLPMLSAGAAYLHTPTLQDNYTSKARMDRL